LFKKDCYIVFGDPPLRWLSQIWWPGFQILSMWSSEIPLVLIALTGRLWKRKREN
jgi:hypothetical protein